MPASRAILVTGSDSEVYDLLVEASSARDWLIKGGGTLMFGRLGTFCR